MLDAPTPIPPEPTKQVTFNSLPLIEKWRWSGSIHSSGSPAISIDDERIAIAANEYFVGQKIAILDANSGQTIWESDNIANLSSLYANNKHVYVGSIRFVRAYDLETGLVLWEGAQQPKDKRGGLEVYPKGEQLEVYDFYGGRLSLLDIKTGQTIDELQLPLPFFKKNNIYYSGACGNGYKMNCLSATNLSGKSLWSRNFGDSIYSWPAFIDDTMFINAGGELFAFKAETGDIIWQTTGANFITPAVLGDNLLYAIRGDAAIVGLDPKTGKQVGIIEMMPNEAPSQNKGGYTTYYTIAVSDKLVAVYYSISQELIVFEKKDNNTGK